MLYLFTKKNPFEYGNKTFYYADDEKTERLNKYFSSISTVDETNASLPTFNFKTQSRISQIEISSEEIECFINNLSINKVVGQDLISHKFLKMVKTSIAQPLTKLFNKSLIDMKFPRFEFTHHS